MWRLLLEPSQDRRARNDHISNYMEQKWVESSFLKDKREGMRVRQRCTFPHMWETLLDEETGLDEFNLPGNRSDLYKEHLSIVCMKTAARSATEEGFWFYILHQWSSGGNQFRACKGCLLAACIRCHIGGKGVSNSVLSSNSFFCFSFMEIVHWTFLLFCFESWGRFPWSPGWLSSLGSQVWFSFLHRCMPTTPIGRYFELRPT